MYSIFQTETASFHSTNHTLVILILIVAVQSACVPGAVGSD